MTVHEFIDKTGASDEKFRKRFASFRDELDEFLDELVNRVDECEGSFLRTAAGSGLWLHTPEQITAWIRDTQEAWHSGQYTSYPDETADVDS